MSVKPIVILPRKNPKSKHYSFLFLENLYKFVKLTERSPPDLNSLDLDLTERMNILPNNTADPNIVPCFGNIYI